MSHIFISYSRRDLSVAQKIVTALSENKMDTWIDWKSIPKGEDWQQEIYQGIEEAEAFLFLISTDSVISEPCNLEIVHAINNGKRILPIFIANVDNKEVYSVTDKFPNNEVKIEINRRNFIFCREGKDDFDKAIAEIQTTIHTDYEWLEYHTSLLVKALEWKKTKDDSRLLRGKELSEAEQRLSIIGRQSDPQPTELQRELISASRKDGNKRKNRTRLFTFLFLAVIIVACIAGTILLDRTPAKVTANGQAIEIRNRFNYRFFNEDTGSTISTFVEPQIFEISNGKYRVIAGTGVDGERPGTVLVYDMHGKLQWEYTFGEDPYNGPPGNFQIKHIYIDNILGNGEPQIVVTAQKSDWFPSVLALLDAEGNLLGSYWNPGFIYDVLNQDLDGDGVKEMIVSAVNNNLGLLANDATKHPVTLYVLSPTQDFTGQAFPDLVSNLPVGNEYNNWIAVFEPTVVGRIRLQSTELNGEALIEVVFNPQGGYLWLDEFGRIQRVGLSDYWLTQQEGRSPAEFICFLTHEGEDWYISGQTNGEEYCPWFAGN